MPERMDAAPAMSGLDVTTGGELVAPAAQVTEDAHNDCVSRKIPILKKEHPDWTQEHILGAAYGICREHKKQLLRHVTRDMNYRKILRVKNCGQYEGGSYTIREDDGSPIGMPTLAAVDHAGIDMKNMSVPVIVTTMKQDNYGDVVDTAGGNFTEYYANPVVLLNHQSYGEHGLPIGKAEDKNGNCTLQVDVEKGMVLSRTFFSQSPGPVGECALQVFHLICEKILRGVSIGFDVDKDADAVQQMFDTRTAPPAFIGLYYRRWKMLEYSHVTIPANSDCQVLARSVLSKGKIDGRPILPMIRKSLEAIIPARMPWANGFTTEVKGMTTALQPHIATAPLPTGKEGTASVATISVPMEQLDNGGVLITRADDPKKKKPEEKPGEKKPDEKGEGKPAGKAPVAKPEEEQPPVGEHREEARPSNSEITPASQEKQPGGEGKEPLMLQGARTNLAVHQKLNDLMSFMTDELPKQDRESMRDHLPKMMDHVKAGMDMHGEYCGMEYPDLNLDEPSDESVQEPEGPSKPPMEQRGFKKSRLQEDAIHMVTKAKSFLAALTKDDRFDATECAAIEYHIRNLELCETMPEEPWTPESEAKALIELTKMRKEAERQTRILAMSVSKKR